MSHEGKILTIRRKKLLVHEARDRIIFKSLNRKYGAPTVVQWVKNLTTVVQVAAEVWVQSLAWCSGLKDPACPLLAEECLK